MLPERHRPMVYDDEMPFAEQPTVGPAPHRERRGAAEIAA
jgi:hypothetical protein